MSRTYQAFRASKRDIVAPCGFEVDDSELSPVLFPFQRALVKWALRKGRCALFCDTGLGKTPMQVDWARIIAEKTGGEVLITAPLNVARQSVRLVKDLGMSTIQYVRSEGTITEPLIITNYELIKHFKPERYAGIVCDESSILKSLTGAIRQELTDMFVRTPYKLCCTATPAPNDIAEIANHAEFLGIKTRTDMMAQYFVHDQNGYRLMKHAEQAFYRWMASWAMSVRRPSDIGFSDEGYILPPLNVYPEFIEVDYQPSDALFFTGLKGITDRSNVRKATTKQKVDRAAEIINSTDEQWLVWHGLNDEGHLLKPLLKDCRLIEGSDSLESKLSALEDFQDGKFQTLISKIRIFGWGSNFQNCHNVMHVGLNDSWEGWYQGNRRVYRFGQTHPVNVHVVLTELEHEIYDNVMDKEREANIMAEQLIEHVKNYEQEELHAVTSQDFEYREDEAKGDDWRILLGDSVERLKELPNDSVYLTVTSPPFESLYSYSPTERDIGNCRNSDEFFEHFGFIIDELLRVTVPGRIAAIHVSDIPAMLVRDGYIGLKDFSGDVLRAFIAHGWVFDARVPIDKNQQAQSIRTHAKGLTMTQMEKDRSWSRPAMPDYILKFRKPGDNPTPVANLDVTRDQWIEFANPTWPNEDDRCAESGAYATWYGIKESDTLQGWQQAKGAGDTRHICPLQLGTIERCVRLWSNAGELVLDPFNGIASTGYVARNWKRHYLGIELKPEYFKVAVKNMMAMDTASEQVNLFSDEVAV